jgi:hypothetical protein
MHQFRLLLWQFYKPLLITNLIATLCALYAIFQDGLQVLFIAVVFKLIGYITGTGYQYLTAAQLYYFYRNIGYSMRKLYTISYIIDFACFALTTFMYILIISHAPAKS